MTKRIIGGTTFNTETANLIASKYDPPEIYDTTLFDDLYQTRRGAFLRHYGDRYLATGEPGAAEIEPLGADAAAEWISMNAPPGFSGAHLQGGGDGDDNGARFTLRMPQSFKERVDGIARRQNQSLNTWIMRCLERAAREDEQL